MDPNNHVLKPHMEGFEINPAYQLMVNLGYPSSKKCLLEPPREHHIFLAVTFARALLLPQSAIFLQRAYV